MTLQKLLQQYHSEKKALLGALKEAGIRVPGKPTLTELYALADKNQVVVKH